MASGEDEDNYSISFNCYARPSQRQGFVRFAEVLTRSTASLFLARPHWGKVCPIDAATVRALYHRLTEFQQVCLECDPGAQFRNDWVSRVLFSAE